VSVAIRRYEKQDAEAWDKLVARSWNGTFLHERRYLSYHGERFQDLSLVVEDKRARIVGVFPAALDTTREALVTSHPGLTYGGVVHDGSLRGAKMLEALQVIGESYRAIDLRSLHYKVVPHIYHKVPSSDDLYAFFRLGAVRYRCDLSAAIDLNHQQRSSKLRRRDLSKSRRAGVQVALGPYYFEPFWTALEENLITKYGVRPVHTLEEITRLRDMFPEIKCVVGIVDDEVVAGVVLFCTTKVVHIQYAASSTFGNTVAAQTAIIDYAIEKSREWGARYFDFGTSNEDEGWVLNEGLYRFKTSFGAGGVVHEFYEFSLE
jgi:FemAB family